VQEQALRSHATLMPQDGKRLNSWDFACDAKALAMAGN
jgi:hypothetical protein